MSLRALFALGLLGLGSPLAATPQEPAPVDALAPLVAPLEARDLELRRAFESAGGRALPPKARQRLEAARNAWAKGQGRLLRLMRARMAESRAQGGQITAKEREELRELVRRMRAASRTEPLSQATAELKNRAPELQAAALATASGTAEVTGSAPPIGDIPAEVRSHAASLAGPIEVYEWVRNAVRPELYHGLMKGPLQTLVESAGNDADTAGLLIALLRAKGIPARYVRGTVELPAELATAVTGTSSPDRALRAFQRAGVPSEAVPGPSGTAALRIERVWAEAYLPYANYRGAILDGVERTWVPLDAGLKRLAPPGGVDLRALGFEPQAAFDDYLVAAPGATPLELYRERAKATLADERPGLAYEQVLARRDVIEQRLDLLPASLPYKLLARAEVGYEPPEPLVHHARFVVEADGTLLDASLPVPALLGQRLTLSWVPFEADDEQVAALYGGLTATPPFLIEVKPVLKLGGVTLASGTGGVGLGVKLDFRIELTLPAGNDTVANRVIAGNLTAIGLASGTVEAESGGEDEAARVLARLAFHYLDRWNRSDAELAALLRVVPIRPHVSTCLVQSAVEVEYADGDPLYPVSYDWKGLAIDADRRPSAPVGIDDDAAERDFLLASGLEGSVLEHRLFEVDYEVASVSTAKALQLARTAGIPVLDLGPEDAEAAVEGLPLDEGVKQEIREAAAKGYRIRVPSAPLTYLAWTGVGYLILDSGTGESAFQLQGGHSGGVTAPAVLDLPAELVDVVQRQSETPAPRPGNVAFVQKFDTTDFQTGTVDTELARAFKVLVTDEEGFPVPAAPVTFSVLGGAGSLVDPGTGRASATEITVTSCTVADTRAACAGLKPGEAVAVLRLGRRTDEIPRFTCEEPYTCSCPAIGECDRAVVGYRTQVGLNLVTARSGGAVLAEPFTAFGFPERKPIAGTPGAFEVFVGLQSPPIYNPVNLTVVERLSLRVSDRHGNPISNVAMRVGFEGPPELGPVAPGHSLFREATTTPGHVLREEHYASCAEASPSVIWGQCPGEAESVVTASSSAGAFVYPVLGDSPWSYYKYNIGTVLDPRLGWVKYHTNGLTCPRPDPRECAGYDAPITFVWQGSRGVITNLQGNVVEAYPPGGTAEVGLWADVVYEEARVTRTLDAQGNEHFRAQGTNAWRRERLSNSKFQLQAKTPGTDVSQTAALAGPGRYTAPMMLASTPQLNTVEVAGTHYPPLVRYLNGHGGDVDPATVDPVTLALERVEDSTRPIQIQDHFEVWGVAPRITGLDPTPLFLSPTGVVTRTSSVAHKIDPPEYRALLAPNDIRFEVRAAADHAEVLAANGGEAQAFTIPGGLSLRGGDHYGRLSVLGVSTTASTNVASPDFPLPVCPILSLHTPIVGLGVVRDPVNGQLCGEEGRIRFTLCRAARVSITLEGRPLTGPVDDGAPRVIDGIELGPGTHVVGVPLGIPELEDDRAEPFRIQARDVQDPEQSAVADGMLHVNEINRTVLPVGRTFVKGIDLLDGHLVQQSTDFKLPGRHLGLELVRSYSSSGSSSEGPLGGGWSLNYASRIFVNESCGLATVVTADGGSQVFRSSDGFVTLTPQKGYHTRLERSGTSWTFTDKGGNRHRFEPPSVGAPPRLEWIEEPHGDRLAFGYDLSSRLTKVAEVHEEAGEVRAVTFSYQPIYGADRIVRAEVAELGLRVDYEYDELGDLRKVTRDGRNLDGVSPAAAPRVESYDYLSLPRGPSGLPQPLHAGKQHQLVRVVDANGAEREYVYYTGRDALPGEAASAGGLLFVDKWERVKQVIEHPGPGVRIRTEFAYDLRDAAAQAEWRTTVRDGRGHDTLYVLNGNGSPTRIDEPLEKTTRLTWAVDDIRKLSERDANGRLTEYDYDPRGNLTLERIVTEDFGPVETRYAYDERFNKLTFKKDAEGRETTYTIDPEDGDLLATVDAVGNRTEYVYDDHGRLEKVIDPRRNPTLHRRHDSFGNPLEVEDALGNVVAREYDLRGRLTRQTDTLGRDSQTSYDGLDRPVRLVRVAGNGSDDEINETEYYPNGEPRLVRNANGAETEFTLDGLNRVIATETRFDGQTLRSSATWDANGNKATETDRRGVTSRHTYDALNRLGRSEITGGLAGEGPIGQVAAYTYDLVGNRLSETNVAGLVTRFEYDDLYRVEAKKLPETMPAGYAPEGTLTERYLRDKVGNLRLVTDPNGQSTSFEYDGLNRRIRVENALGHNTRTTYDDAEGSHVNKSEEHDQTRGLRTTFAYDALNRETERVVILEGPDGNHGHLPRDSADATRYVTSTSYADDVHSVTVTDPRGTPTLTLLDGLDRPFRQTVDPGRLDLVTEMAYDGLGNRKSLKDPESRVTLFGHDGLGRLVETTDALQQKATYTYDGEGLKTGETDRRQISRAFTYDNLRRPRRESLVAAPLSGKAWSRETQYRDVERQRVELDAVGRPTIILLDGLDRPIKETDALGFWRTFVWDGVNKREETDKRPAQHRTRFEYDPLNRLTKTRDPRRIDPPAEGAIVETTYDDAENVTRTRDRRGFVARTQADPLGRVVSITRAFGHEDEAVLETNVYDGNGSKTLATDAEGRKTRFDYDRANRLEEREDGFQSPDAAITTFRYDKAGNLRFELDARAAALGAPWSIERAWDDLNRMETETDGEGNVTGYEYDPEGNRRLVRSPKGHETRFEYEELGRLTKVTQPSPGDGLAQPVTADAYDENRNRVLQTDANTNVVSMEYDELNRLKKTIQDPGNLNLVSETTRFDGNGNPEIFVDPKGQTTTNVYDELNRLTNRSFAFAPGDTTRPWRYTASVRFRYDPNGNLERTEEHVASGTNPPDVTLTTLREYDGLDRLETETQPLPNGTSRTVAYTYFRNGTRKTVKDHEGSVTAYTYDFRNRLHTASTQAETAQPQTTTYTYEPDDLLETVTYPNRVVGTHSYDKADRLVSVTNAKDGATISSFQYTGIHPESGLPVSYDANGNRLIQVETNGGSPETTTYTYDDLDRLETVSYPIDTAFPNGRVVSYGYDAVGNRIRETEKDRSGAILADKQGVFDNVNRLTELTDLVTPANSTAFTWDPNGNQLTKTTAGVTTENRYDLRDKLVEVQLLGSPAPQARFQYDAQGRRNLKIGEESLRQYVYDQTSLLTEYDAGGVQKAKYDYGSDRLISLTRTDEPRRYFSLDGLRSVVNLTDDNGSAVASYHLDAWGNFRFPNELTQSANRFAFTGHIWDQETGLYNAKARYFDPKLGRFLTQDSFLGTQDNPPSLHRYLYGYANPLRYVDPTGHQTVDPNAPPDDVVGGDASLAAVKAGQARDNAASSDKPWSAGPPTPTTVTEEDSLGSKALSLLAGALAKVGEFNKSVETWVGDHVAAWTSKKLQPKGDGAKSEALRQLAQQEPNNPALRATAEGVAGARDIAGGFQDTGTDITRKGAEGGAGLTLEGLEGQGAAKLAGVAFGAVGGAAQKLTRSSRALGAEGESLVIRHLEGKGYTEITAIQNKSGHGIDVFARNKAGELRFFEVKTTTTGEAGRLSTAQRYTEDFITSRLDRAAQAQGQWQNLDPATRRKAADVLAEIRGGAQVKGVKIDVMYPAAGAEGPPQLQFSRWREK